mmetsp:Transcript_34889/g.31412  ORF Transcript_34889/g.31412 Transcript_34889/m.31412 type:complete len:147 (-) Transcript_34889:422-862(-)
MPLDAFKKCFGSYHVGFYHDDFHYSYVEDTNQPNHARYYHFYVAEETEVYFRIHQEDKRFHLGDDGRAGEVVDAGDGYKYCPASFLLCRLHDGDLLENVLDDPDGQVDKKTLFGERSIYLCQDRKVKLKKGEYLLRVKVKWREYSG